MIEEVLTFISQFCSELANRDDIYPSEVARWGRVYWHLRRIYEKHD